MSNVEIKSNNKRRKRKPFIFPSSFTILFFVLVAIMLISWIMYWTGSSFNHTVTYNLNKDTKWSDLNSSVQKYLTDNDLTDVNNFINWLNGKLEGDLTSVTIEIPETDFVKAAGVFDVFTSIFSGFADKIDIIVFVLAIGSFSFVVFKTQALEAITQKLAKKMGNNIIWLIPVAISMFSFLGSTYGMAGESIGLHLIFIPLMMVSGFDKMTAILTVLLGVGVGPLAATVDPFLIATAVDASNSQVAPGAPGVVQFADGIAFRIIIFIVLTAVTSAYVMLYAVKVRRRPEKSVTFNTLEGDKKFFLSESITEIPLTKKRIAVAWIYLLGFVSMILYLFAWDQIFSGSEAGIFSLWINEHIPYLSSWSDGFGVGGMIEVSAIILIFTIIAGAINWHGETALIRDLMDGARDVITVAFVIGMAGGITIMLENTGIKYALVSALGGMGDMNPFAFIVLSYIIFLPISFAIPSTSGFASAIFPMWGGNLANQVVINNSGTGINMVSGSITSFGMANGWANIISPASDIMVGAVELGKVNYSTIVKAIWPYMLIIFGSSVLLLLIGTGLNYTGVHIF